MIELAGHTRELSKVLFNAQHRLTIAALFTTADAPVLGYEEVAERAGVSRSVAHKELALLVRIGALQRVEVGRSVSYQRTDSPFWPFAAALLES